MSACIFLFLFGLQKSSFLCIYSLLREIQLDQNSIFFFKILVLHKNLFKMSCFPWLCWDLNKIIFWWITSVRDHRLTFCTMIPLTFQDTKVIPIILNAVEGRSSAAPSYEAINEGCYSEQKYLDCKEASLRWKVMKEEMCMTNFAGCDWWSKSSYQIQWKRKETSMWAGFPLTPPTLDGGPQCITLNHPDLFFLV